MWYGEASKKADTLDSDTSEENAENAAGPAMMTRVVVNYDPGTQPGARRLVATIFCGLHSHYLLFVIGLLPY